MTLEPAAPLEDLGWDAAWAAELEQLEEPNLVPGRVAAQHRGAYVLWTVAGEIRGEPAGKLLLGTTMPAVGDWVAVRPTPEGDRTTIRAVLSRRSAFSRKQNLGATVEQVLAANVDIAFLVAAVGEDLSARRLERYLTMAWESGARPVVVLTKIDLSDDLSSDLLALETVTIGASLHGVSNVTGEGLEELRGYLGPGRTAVLLGSSGVGKSTLLNRLAGAELMRVSEIAADGTGRHTTTHRELVRLPGGGLVIDTPGLRELQLWDAGEGIHAAFEDVEALALECRFSDCAHTREPGCAVLAAVDKGTLELDRLRSWRKLQKELAALAIRQDKRARAEARKEIKRFSKSLRNTSW